MQQHTYKTISSLLKQIQSENVNKAQEQLKEFVKDPSFFTVMYFVMSDAQEDEWTKTTAACFLNSMFLVAQEQQAINVAFDAIVKILLEPKIKSMDKRSFQKSMIHNLQHTTNENVEKMTKLAVDCLNYNQNLDTALFLLACLGVAQISPSPVPFILDNLYEKIINGIPVNIGNASIVNEMVKLWIVIFDKIKVDEELQHFSRRIIDNPSTYALLEQIYLLEAQQKLIATFTSGLQELNFLKFQAADLHKRILCFEENYSKEPCPLLITFTSRYSQKMLMTLATLASQPEVTQNFGCEDMLTSFLSVIRFYLMLEPTQFKLQDVINFQNIILFPLLKITDNQKCTFQEEPVQFNTLAQDCCDKQMSGTLKTEAAKLLQKFGDKIQGSLKYSLNRAIDSLKIQLGINPLNNYELPVLEIQTSFLVLTIFSYGVGEYKEQTNEIKAILLNPNILKLPPLEISRIFTFLGYNYGEIFEDEASGEGWLQFAITYNAHPTTSFCAFDFFSNIVEDYFSQNLLDKFTDHISSGRMGITWQIVHKILRNHFRQLSAQGISTFIDKIFMRIKLQIQLLKTKQKNQSLDLTNSLRSISTILDQIKKEMQVNNQVSSKRDFILTKIYPLFQIFQIAKELDMDDQVIKVAVHILNCNTTIPQGIKNYLNLFLSHYSLFYEERIYIKFFNQFIMKSNFGNDQQEIIAVLIAVKNSLFNISQKLIEPGQEGKIKSLPHYRISLNNTLILVQNSLAVFGSSLIKSYSLQYFHEISSIISRMLPNSVEQIEKTAAGRILQSRALNVLFLCHMHVRIDSIYETLIMVQYGKLYHGYDTKVLVMCIQAQILNEVDHTSIMMLLSALSKIASLSQQKEQSIQRKKNKKNYGVKSSKINNSLRAYDEYDRILKSIESPFKNDKDVSQLLIEMFTTMKKNNEEIFNGILSNMSHEDYQNYCKFVNFEQLQKKKRVIRKVVGIKVGNTVDNRIEAEMDNDQSQNEEENNPLKRQRVVIKSKKKKAKDMTFVRHKERKE